MIFQTLGLPVDQTVCLVFTCDGVTVVVRRSFFSELC